MKVLLKEDVDNLGSVGDEVDVKPGYARNYLVPQGKALFSTPDNVKAYEHQKRVVNKRLKKLKAGADEIAGKIASLTCIVKKKVGDQGKLFGSVTTQEVADFLNSNGVHIDRRKLQMSEPIKTLGEHQVSIKLHPEVIAQVRVVVESEDPEPAAKKEAEAPVAEEATPAETESAE